MLTSQIRPEKPLKNKYRRNNHPSQHLRQSQEVKPVNQAKISYSQPHDDRKFSGFMLELTIGLTRIWLI
jgi:hypothetical protein